MNTNDINTGDEHPEIRDQLRNLPMLRASDDFVKNLQLKIDIHNAEAGKMHSRVNDRTAELQKSGFFKNIFGASWTMPAAGITVAAAIVFAIIFWNKGTDTAIQEKLSQTTTPAEIIQEGSGNLKNNAESNTLAETKKESSTPLKKEMASTDQYGFMDKDSKIQVNSSKNRSDLHSTMTDEQKPEVKNLEQPVGKVNTGFVTEEKSAKVNESEDANLRKKLQMGNARGGDSKANSPSAPPKSGDTEESGKITDVESKVKTKTLKKSVKDVIDISKTSLESIKAKVK